MVPKGANGGGVLAPVSVDEARGAVWAATGAPYRTLPGDNPGTCALVELSLRDGHVRWMDQVHPGDRRGLDLNSAPLLLGRLAVVTSKDGVYAWDRLARRRLWRRQLTAPSARRGQPSGPQDGPEGGPIATDGRRIYALSNDAAVEAFTVAALRPSDGRVIWRRSLSGSVFAAPACSSRTLVVAGAFGPVYQMDGATGRGLENGTLGEATACAPAIGRGLVLAGTGAGRFLPGSSLVALGHILPTSG
jgi:outer membrane protein assembly factor BamB